MTTVNESTSKVIRIGTVIGIAVLAVGLLASGTDLGGSILLAGVVLLVLTPFAGVLTSMTCLFRSGDRTWGAVAAALVVIVVVGLLITLLT